MTPHAHKTSAARPEEQSDGIKIPSNSVSSEQPQRIQLVRDAVGISDINFSAVWLESKDVLCILCA
jgi:hypothetical protein